jgi:hypothetical protein
MEITKAEFGLEQVWSDSDALSWSGFKAIHHDAVLLGQGSILGENVTIGNCFERAWSDADALINTQSPRLLNKAA